VTSVRPARTGRFAEPSGDRREQAGGLARACPPAGRGHRPVRRARLRSERNRHLDQGRRGVDPAQAASSRRLPDCPRRGAREVGSVCRSWATVGRGSREEVGSACLSWATQRHRDFADLAPAPPRAQTAGPAAAVLAGRHRWPSLAAWEACGPGHLPIALAPMGRRPWLAAWPGRCGCRWPYGRPLQHGHERRCRRSPCQAPRPHPQVKRNLTLTPSGRGVPVRAEHDLARWQRLRLQQVPNALTLALVSGRGWAHLDRDGRQLAGEKMSPSLRAPACGLFGLRRGAQALPRGQARREGEPWLHRLRSARPDGIWRRERRACLAPQCRRTFRPGPRTG